MESQCSVVCIFLVIQPVERFFVELLAIRVIQLMCALIVLFVLCILHF